MATRRLKARPVGRDGEWVVEIAEQHPFRRRDAAVALASTLARIPRSVGEQTVLKAMRKVAEATEPPPPPDEEAVATYLEALDADGLWARIAPPGRPGVEPTRTIYVMRQYNLDEAAALLAALYERRPRKLGYRTAHEGLIEATNTGVVAPKRPGKAHVKRRDLWRALLVEVDMFPAQAAEPSRGGSGGDSPVS